MQLGTIIKTFQNIETIDSYKIGKVIAINDEYITCDTVKVVQNGIQMDTSDVLYPEKFRILVQLPLFASTPLPIIEEIG